MQMKKFCTTCGHQNGELNLVCEECGTKLQQPLNQKNKLSRKRKTIYSLIGILIVGSLAFHSWGTKEASAKSVAKKLNESALSGNFIEMQKHLYKPNGQKLTEFEVKAFQKLIKKSGNENWLNRLQIKKDGKYLGVFSTYRFIVPTVAMIYETEFDDIELIIDKKKIPNETENISDEFFTITYQEVPVGIYKATLRYKGELVESEKTQEIVVDEYNGQEQYFPFDLELSNVNLAIEDYYSINKEKLSVILNDKEIPFKKSEDYLTFGPITLNGNNSVKIVYSTPYGKLETESVNLEEQYNEVDWASFNQEIIGSISGMLSEFGESYVQGIATNDYKKAVHVNNNSGRYIKGIIEDYNYWTPVKTTKLIETSIESVTPRFTDEVNELLLDVAYTFDYTQDSNVYSEEDYYEITALYNETTKKWVINEMESSWGLDSYDLIIPGKNSVYSQSSQISSVNAEKVSDIDFQPIVEEYYVASVSSLNSNDFSIVEPYLTTSGSRYQEQKDYLDYLVSKSITEEFISVEVEKVEEVNENTVKITSMDAFTIINSSGASDKKYRSVTVLKKVDEQWLVDELISTTEL